MKRYNAIFVFFSVFLLGSSLHAEFKIPDPDKLSFQELWRIQFEREKLFPQTLEKLKAGNLYRSIGKLPSEKTWWQKVRGLVTMDVQATQVDFINKSQADIVARVTAYQNYLDKPASESMSNDDYFENYVKALRSMNAPALDEATNRLEAYLNFERGLQPLRDYFKGRPVAATLITDEIRRGATFEGWFNDYLQAGPNFPVTAERASSIVAFYATALNTFNTITRENLNDEGVLKHSEAAYRTVILRLQVIDPTRQLNDPVEQRQLAKNGMTSITQAYKALASTIGCSATMCSNGKAKELLELFKTNAYSWMEKNPLEAEVLVKELDHAYSILTSSGQTTAGLLLDFASGILNRRLAADFLKEAIHGNYERIVDPSSKLRPEIIALVHMAPALPYAASTVKSLLGGTNLVAHIGGAAIALATGAAVPAALALAGTIVGGLVQVKMKNKATDMLTSNAQATAFMKGLLSLARDGNLTAAISSAATLYLARQGTQLFGNLATDWRESRWLKVAEGAALVGAGAYAYCTGDTTAATTFAAMLCGHRYTVYQNPCSKINTCQRIDEWIKNIANNMKLDADMLKNSAYDAAQKEGEAKSAFNSLVDKLSAKVGKEEVVKSFDSLFANQKSLFGGADLLNIMAGVKAGG